MILNEVRKQNDTHSAKHSISGRELYDKNQRILFFSLTNYPSSTLVSNAFHNQAENPKSVSFAGHNVRNYMVLYIVNNTK